MTVLDDLLSIKEAVENGLGIDLADKDFADGREEIVHIFLHETCHAAVSHCVPWIHTLSEEEHTAVDELMARFLEKEIGESLGLFVHSTAEFMEELKRYPVEITLEEYRHLSAVWEEYFRLQKDLAGMAAYTLACLQYGELVYHLLPQADWEQAQVAGIYKPAGLPADGFIHCSKIDQVVNVANGYYGGCSDMVLLCIAADRVGADIKYEDLLGEGQCFPHIYGSLNLDAVVGVLPMKKDAEGKFVLPTEPIALSI